MVPHSTSTGGSGEGVKGADSSPASAYKHNPPGSFLGRVGRAGVDLQIYREVTADPQVAGWVAD